MALLGEGLGMWLLAPLSAMIEGEALSTRKAQMPKPPRTVEGSVGDVCGREG